MTNEEVYTVEELKVLEESTTHGNVFDNGMTKFERSIESRLITNDNLPYATDQAVNHRTLRTRIEDNLKQNISDLQRHIAVENSVLVLMQKQLANFRRTGKL